MDFEGGGDLLPFLKEIRANVNGLRDDSGKTQAAITADLKTSTQSAKEFTTAVGVSATTAASVGKGAAAGLDQVDKSLAKTTAGAKSFAGALTEVERTALKGTNDALKQIAQQQGIVVGKASQHKVAVIDTVVALKGLSKEEGDILKETVAITEAFEQVEGTVGRTAVGAETIKSQIRQLKEEAAQAALAGDEITYARATREAGELQETLKDTAASINAFNPDDKAGAFGRMFSVIGNGVQAVGGIAVAFGVSDQAIEKAFFRLQSFVTGFQGAAAFIKDFGDTYRDFLRVLGLSTAATVKSTVASEVDTVAKTAQAGATAELGVATTATNTATKGLWATFIASPLAPLLLLLGAVAGAMALLVGKTEEETKAYSDLVDEIDRTFDNTSAAIALGAAQKLREAEEDRAARLADVALGKRKDAELTAEEQKAEEKRNKEIDQLTINAINAQREARRAAAIELKDLFQRVFDADGNVDITASTKQIEDLANALGLETTATADEIRETYNRVMKDLVKFGADSGAQIEGLQQRQSAAANDRREKELADIAAKAKATLQIREQLAANIEAIEKQLLDKLRALQTGAADPRERLELERKAEEEGLATLEKNLRREIALREIGAAKLIDLTEKQKQVLADARIAEGGGQLSPKNEEDYANARLLIWLDYFRKVSNLQSEFDQTIADASGDEQVKQLAELDTLLAEREKKLKEAGETPAEIEADAQRQTLAVQTKFSKDRIERETQTQVDILEAMLNGGNLSVAQERAIQVAILEEKIKGAEAALALIVDNGSAIADAEIAEAKNIIGKLKRELRELTAGITPFKLSDLFDLSGDAADQFNKAASDLNDALQDIASANIEAQQMQLDAQIETTDAIIDDLQRRGDELQAQLEEDEQLQRDGLANNLDATLAAIEENKKAQQAALADKKRIQAESAKLARQQALIDSAQQASSLATSGANLIAGWSGLPFGVGLIAAFAQIAAMVAFFSGLKNRLAAASAPQQLKTGTKSVELQGNPDGVDTVPAMLTRDEAVVPVAENRKHRALVGAIIDDDFSRLTPKQLAPILERINITPFLEEHGITVNEQAVSRVVTTNNTHRERVEKSQAVDLSGVEKRLDELTKEVKSFRKQEGAKPDKTTLPDGTVMIRTPGKTEYIRK